MENFLLSFSFIIFVRKKNKMRRRYKKPYGIFCSPWNYRLQNPETVRSRGPTGSNRPATYLSKNIEITVLG